MLPPLFALFSWPVISLVLFRKLALPLAILVTIVGGFLLLPQRGGIDFPGLTLNKASIPALSALCFALIFASRDTSHLRPKGWLPRHPLALALLIAIPVGAVMTALTNGDGLRYGPRSLPGLTLYDAASMASGALIMVLPLLLARRYLADAAAQRLILKVLCIAALGYSLFAIIEMRMSPQMSNWVYGFFPHSWAQHYRAGGWRPVVFLPHGLVLGIFFAMSVMAIVGLVRIDASRRRLWVVSTIWLFVILVLSRNFGALLITVALLPVLFFTNIRGQLLVAALICGVFLAYPAARTAQVLPIDQFLQFAESIGAERAAESFRVRLFHEDQLLAKAAERPVFGWGIWSRSRVFDDKGYDISITDGAWAIILGVSGWVGYLAQFGLVTAPALLLWLHRRRYEIGMETSVLAVILAANMVDMIPNSSNLTLTWLLAGALWGRLELQAEAGTHAETAVASPAHVEYRRSDPEAAGDPQPVAPPASTPPVNPYTRQTRRIHRKGSTAG